jgi:hypothetical protein
MKTLQNPYFIIISLCLCFPLGLFLLIKSELNTKRKWICGIAGALIFLTLITLALLPWDFKETATSYEIIATRETLAIGESGGFAVCGKNSVISDFKATSNNDVVAVSDNIYTAQKEGNCTITVEYLGQTKSFTITVDGNAPKDFDVFITAKGTRYHKTSNHAGKSALKISEEEALMSGKTPCKICYKNQ